MVSFKPRAYICPAREQFNIDNGITLVRESQGMSHFYCFGSSRENTHLVNFYLNNIDLLEHFINFFNYKSQPLVKAAQADRCVLPAYTKEQSLISQHSKGPVTSSYKIAESQKTKFLQQLHFGDFKVNPLLQLTQREMDCLSQMCQAKTAKEIGMALTISNRTVETYIQNIKLKTGAKTKSELLQLFNQFNCPAFYSS